MHIHPCVFASHSLSFLASLDHTNHSSTVQVGVDNGRTSIVMGSRQSPRKEKSGYVKVVLKHLGTKHVTYATELGG